jgi:hypothetical protein
MTNVYQRIHRHFGGSIIPTVTENGDGSCSISLRSIRPADGREILMPCGSVGASTTALVEAQRQADAKANELLEALGHQCSAECQSWPSALIEGSVTLVTSADQTAATHGSSDRQPKKRKRGPKG